MARGLEGVDVQVDARLGVYWIWVVGRGRGKFRDVKSAELRC